MSSGLRLALLTLNLSQSDFVRMDRDNLKKYIENFFKQEYVQKDFEKYKIAARIALENKPKVEEENIYNNVNVEEENRYVRRNIDENQYNSSNPNLFNNTFFHPFSMLNNNFSTMMNKIDNLHQNFGNLNIGKNINNLDNYSDSSMINTNSSNMINTSNSANGFTSSYSKTYVNNNGNGYIKEESMEKNNDGIPKIKSFYRKIVNGKYVEEPNITSQKFIEK